MTQGLERIIGVKKPAEGVLLFSNKKEKTEESDFQALLDLDRSPEPRSTPLDKKGISTPISVAKREARRHPKPQETGQIQESTSKLQSEEVLQKETVRSKKHAAEEDLIQERDSTEEEALDFETKITGFFPEQKVNIIEAKESTSKERVTEDASAKPKADYHRAFEEFKREFLHRDVSVTVERTLIPDEEPKLSFETTLTLMDGEALRTLMSEGSVEILEGTALHPINSQRSNREIIDGSMKEPSIIDQENEPIKEMTNTSLDGREDFSSEGGEAEKSL